MFNIVPYPFFGSKADIGVFDNKGIKI